MTCASCAARVERKLNRLDGVTATVNFATEAARVSFPETLTVGDLIAAVERTGYTAALPAPRRRRAGRGRRGLVAPGAAPADGVSVALAVPVVLLAMVPALQFADWQWVSLAAATPVATWGAWPFHRAALISARHGAATMDTLVSLGVSAAYLWSLYALFLAGGRDARHLPGGGVRGHRADPARPVPGGAGEAERRRGAARAARPGREAGDGAQGRTGAQRPRRPAPAWATSSSSGRGRRSRPTASSSAAARRLTPRC